MTAPSSPGDRERRFLDAFKAEVDRNERSLRSMRWALYGNTFACVVNLILLLLFFAAREGWL